MPMARVGKIHMLNNYYDCTGNGSNAINPRKNSEFLIEGNYFEKNVKYYGQSGATAVTWSTTNHIEGSSVQPSNVGSTVTVVLIPVLLNAVRTVLSEEHTVRTLNGNSTGREDNVYIRILLLIERLVADSNLEGSVLRLSIELLLEPCTGDSPSEGRGLRIVSIVVVDNSTNVSCRINKSCSEACIGGLHRSSAVLLNVTKSVDNELTVTIVVSIELSLGSTEHAEHVVLNHVPSGAEAEVSGNTLRLVLNLIASVVDNHVGQNLLSDGLVGDADLDVTVVKHTVAIVGVDQSDTHDGLTTYSVSTDIFHRLVQSGELIIGISLTICLRNLRTEGAAADTSVSSLTGAVTTFEAGGQFEVVSQTIASEIVSAHHLVNTISIAVVSLNQLREVESLVITANILIGLSHSLINGRHEVQVNLGGQRAVVSRVQVVIHICEVMITVVLLASEAQSSGNMRKHELVDCGLVDSCIVRSDSGVLTVAAVLSLGSEDSNHSVVRYALDLRRIVELQRHVKMAAVLLVHLLTISVKLHRHNRSRSTCGDEVLVGIEDFHIIGNVGNRRIHVIVSNHVKSGRTGV